MSHPEITLRAELDGVRRDPLVSLPVIPPERIPDFQRAWYRRPELRALIRAAGQLEEAEVAHQPHRARPVGARAQRRLGSGRPRPVLRLPGVRCIVPSETAMTPNPRLIAIAGDARFANRRQGKTA